VRDFVCPNCGQQLTFENSVCLGCRSNLGFDPDAITFVTITASGVHEHTGKRRCVNLNIASCNWLAQPDARFGLCPSCELTRTRPADGDEKALALFAEAELAKRRLVVELSELGLHLTRKLEDGDGGIAFDLLSSAKQKVFTGHLNGVITLDLAESDDVHRERLRVSMAEPYRTLLGHFRHEIGHFFFDVLLDDDASRRNFEQLFGDPRASYADAVERHYKQGPPRNWRQNYVSAYATMHPYEDWAETFAHYLHIRDTLDTAAAFGMAPAGATLATPLAGQVGFQRLVDLWLPLAWSLNMINRSMGHTDLYPFVLPPPALRKMALVHEQIRCGGA